MNLKQALYHARTALREKDIEDATLEGEILLRYVLGIDRARLFSHLDDELASNQETVMKRALERRCQGEPTAYITGRREFYGLDFIVNRDVLIPRPESELLVTKAIEIAKTCEIRQIADIGTGSGAISVSLAVNLPEVTVYATDISSRALEVAAQNCREYGVTDRVILLHGDILGPLTDPVDLIVANLPYVSASELTGNGPLSFEPALALNGGRDGLEKIEVFCRQVGIRLRREGRLLLEIGQGQAESVSGLLRKALPGSEIEIDRDLAGIERLVSLRLTRGKVF